MRIEVDYTLCQGFGVCESITPDFFRVEEDETMMLLMSEVPKDREDELRQAVDSCPMDALRLTD